MSTDLPAVPEEAIRATAAALGWAELSTVRRVIRAALPHLYAAALRHAANRIEADLKSKPPTLEALLAGTAFALSLTEETTVAPFGCAQLRRMADEAVQG